MNYKLAVDEGKWNNPHSWSPAGVPGPNDTVNIPGDMFVIIPQGYTVTVGPQGVVNVGGGDGGYIVNEGAIFNGGAIVIDNGSIHINEDALLENNGSITCQLGYCSILVSGTLNNNATGTIITNGGSVAVSTNINNSGTIDNYGTITFNNATLSFLGTGDELSPNFSGTLNTAPPSVFVMESGSTLALGPGTTLTIQGNAANPVDTYSFYLPTGVQISVNPGATLVILPAGVLNVAGTVNNNGTIQIQPFAGGYAGNNLLVLQGGTLNNNNNYKALVNGLPSGQGGTIDNSGVFANSGTVYNGGKLAVGVDRAAVAFGVFNNKGWVENWGVITNYGVFNNEKTIVNYATFHKATGTLNNTGEIEGPNPLEP